ncbi:MAG: preprotein translocase subunit SecY [Deltaproteobacteria bacterium]|nr:preprotein translocase subunit SecY [Deltaproteobacteria bacterium]
MASGFANIGKIPELRRRVLFTIALLAVYRIGIFVSVPGADHTVMKEYLSQAGGAFLGMFNMFTGGALEQLSIFALGIMPYVSASIILSILAVIVPSLRALQKEGEMGQRKINQYTRYGTIVLSIVQGLAMAFAFEGMISNAGIRVVSEPGWSFRLMTVVCLTTGTAFIMWLGEQITERGIGNGISLIIFAGIVARLPAAVALTWQQVSMGEIKPLFLLVLAVLIIVVVATIIFFERGQRRITVQYPRRTVGRRVFGGQSTHLPLRVNQSGVIPPIFASSILMFPGTLANLGIPFMDDLAASLNRSGWIYNTLYVAGIIFFCFFYTAVTFRPDDVADNLKKQGAFIPGIRPGRKTAEYIDRVMSRITFGGAMYVSAVCLLPTYLIQEYNVPFYFGGTSLMIVVGVALDTVQQIESHMITRHYDGFTGPGGARIRGRRARA